MMWKIISAGIIAALSAALFVLVIDAPPTTAELDTEIAGVQKEISVAKKRSDEYSGGLIKSLIEVRIEILSTTASMLAAKRASVLRRISLSFEIDGSQFKATLDPDRIQAEIATAQKRVVAAQSEAAKYAGGVLQVLQLVKAATEEITVAQLQSAYYSAKYGLPTIGAFLPKDALHENNAVPVGKVVKDKDAL